MRCPESQYMRPLPRVYHLHESVITIQEKWKTAVYYSSENIHSAVQPSIKTNSKSTLLLRFNIRNRTVAFRPSIARGLALSHIYIQLSIRLLWWKKRSVITIYTHNYTAVNRGIPYFCLQNFWFLGSKSLSLGVKSLTLLGEIQYIGVWIKGEKVWHTCHRQLVVFIGIYCDIQTVMLNISAFQ